MRKLTLSLVLFLSTLAIAQQGTGGGGGQGTGGNQGNASALQGIPIATTTPTNGQCLVYNSGSLNYVPATCGSGSGTVTSVGLVGTANQITITGASPITTSGSWTVSLPALVQTGTFNATSGYQLNGLALASTNLSDSSGIVRYGTAGLFTTIQNFGTQGFQFNGSGSGTTNVIVPATAGGFNLSLPAILAADTLVTLNLANPFAAVARTSGVTPYFSIQIPADTGITTATEAPGFQTLTGTRTWVDGTVATQRENLFAAPTYNKTTTSATFTKAATVAISGAPIAGSGVTITNPYAFWVQGGTSELDGNSFLTPAVRNAAAGITPYFQITTPGDGASTGLTTTVESNGFSLLTGTRTWAAGVTPVQREVLFAGPTYAGSSATATFTDAATVGITPPIVGSNAAITRIHSLVIVDSTSSAGATTGGFIVAATLGTAATSVGIGGGNVVAGAGLTAISTVKSPVFESTATNTAVTFQGGLDANTTGASGTAVFRGENVTAGSTASIAGGAVTVNGGDNGSSGATETGGALTLRGGDTTNASAAVQTTGSVTIRGGNNSSTGVSTLGTVTITGGTQSGAATNGPGGDVIIAGGLGTGSGTAAHVKIQSPTLLASGSTAQAQVTRIVTTVKAGSTTTATNTGILTIPIAANQTVGLTIWVHVETTQATPHNCATEEDFHMVAQNTGGTITQQTTATTGLGTICDTGTLTIVPSLTTASTPITLNIAPAWTVIAPSAVTITVTIINNSQQEITLL